MGLISEMQGIFVQEQLVDRQCFEVVLSRLRQLLVVSKIYWTGGDKHGNCTFDSMVWIQ